MSWEVLRFTDLLVEINFLVGVASPVVENIWDSQTLELKNIYLLSEKMNHLGESKRHLVEEHESSG